MLLPEVELAHVRRGRVPTGGVAPDVEMKLADVQEGRLTNLVGGVPIVVDGQSDRCRRDEFCCGAGISTAPLAPFAAALSAFADTYAS